MGRALFSGIALCFAAGFAIAQPGSDREEPTDNRLVFASGNPYLASGADAIRFGSYREGIRLTERGLERGNNSPHDEAAAHSNICAAYAALNEPDSAIEHCNTSLEINSGNWRAYSNRAYAYWLKGMYVEARFDVDAAAAISPRARQLPQIRGMINESTLQPRVLMEDHQ